MLANNPMLGMLEFEKQSLEAGKKWLHEWVIRWLVWV